MDCSFKRQECSNKKKILLRTSPTLQKKQTIIETDDGKGVRSCKQIVLSFRKEQYHRYNRYSCKGAVFAKRFTKTIRYLLKKTSV